MAAPAPEIDVGSTGHHHGLTMPQKVGIGISAVAALLVAIGLLVFIRRRAGKHLQQQQPPPDVVGVELAAAPHAGGSGTATPHAGGGGTATTPAGSSPAGSYSSGESAQTVIVHASTSPPVNLLEMFGSPIQHVLDLDFDYLDSPDHVLDLDLDFDSSGAGGDEELP